MALRPGRRLQRIHPHRGQSQRALCAADTSGAASAVRRRPWLRLRDLPEVPEEHCKWRFRRLLEEDGTRQFIVGAATRFDPIVQAAFSAYVPLRHHEVTVRTGMAEESSTLGVLLTPRHDGVRPWDTSAVRVHGDLDLSEEEIQVYSEEWNRAAENADVSVSG